MLYRFAWVLMWITFKIYFRRIDVIGLEKLEKDKPYILVANHPASFLDAMVLAVFLKRDLHFYVRGDIFKHPLAFKFLTWLHMIPIFSREHGMENVGRNYNTFERGKKLLQQGKLLLIFPEGFSRLSKSIEPMKKGPARVALQTAFDDGGLNHLSIQSIALNYSYHGVQSDILIRLGESFPLVHYAGIYTESPAKAISMLTSDLTPFFERNIIHIQDGNKTLVAEEIMRMEFNDCMGEPSKFFEQARLRCEKLDTKVDQAYDQYVEVLNQYKKLLHVHGLVDRSFSNNNPPHIMGLLNLLLTIEFYLFAKVFWLFPGKLVKWIADKTVTRIDFYTSVYSGVLAFTCLIWWLGWMIFVFQTDLMLLKVSITFSPFFAYIAMQWEHDFADLKSDLKLKNLKSTAPSLVKQLEEMRSFLLS
jgi:1-acyl-sn-glycerol-3-phosphate acyltransferase